MSVGVSDLTLYLASLHETLLKKTASGSLTLLRLAKVPFGRTGTGAAGKNGIKILSVMVQLSKKPQRR